MSEPRCEVCDWPLAATAAEGCVPGNCSYRPQDGEERARILRRREELAAPRVAGPLTIDIARREIDRLRALERLVQRWARAHRAHHVHSTMTEAKGDPPYVPRAEFLAIERVLLAAARGGT
jgi:hypothetical protein